ncbi:MAG: NADH-quinone oxidoreductase subunit N [Candidatus Micrarchaeota archaeon]|nr:NADH-quinone oxidoreductase subunit N [Candidatus Micrarchaeota archaeon]
MIIEYTIGALAVLLAASGLSTLLHRNARIALASNVVFLALIGATFAYAFATGYYASSAIQVSQFSSLFGVLFSITLIFASVLSYAYSNRFSALSALLSVVAVGVMIVDTSNSLISLILGMEAIAVPTVFLIALESGSAEPAVKFFVMSAMAVAAFALGIAALMAYDPGLSIAFSSISAPVSGLMLLGALLAVAALSFEASLFPFNLWIPDVYQGAKSNITALLAGINKKVAFVALAYVSFVLFAAYIPKLAPAFLALSVLTMFFGNIMALVQKNVKRMFAYSSISQAGYILIGFATATQYGIGASIYQIIAHSFTIIGSFAIILWLEQQGKQSVDDYSALSKRAPLAAATLTVFMLSLAGLPPLAGFYGKFLLFSGAVSGGLLSLALVGILNSFISIYYYGRLMLSIYSNGRPKLIGMPTPITFVMLACLVVVVAIGLYPQPVIAAANSASSYLFGAFNTPASSPAPG